MKRSFVNGCKGGCVAPVPGPGLPLRQQGRGFALKSGITPWRGWRQRLLATLGGMTAVQIGMEIT